MSQVLTFAEIKDGRLRGVATETAGAGARLAAELGGVAHAVILGSDAVAGEAEGLGAAGAAEILTVLDPRLERYDPELYAAALVQVIRAGDYAAVLLPATSMGKDLAPRVAALLDVPLAGDATGLSGEGGTVVVTRPAYSGKAFARLSIDAPIALVTLRPNAFPAAAEPAAGTVRSVPVGDLPTPRMQVVEFEASGSGTVDLSEATTIVSGGRGLKGAEEWGVLEALVEALGPGTALGASRAVVDAGWRPHGEQVGQTGKTVAPRLYFAVGISGAIQHLAGMRTAGTIVAVNKDADAPIFQLADYGIVGDLFEVVPRLAEEIRTLRAQG